MEGKIPYSLVILPSIEGKITYSLLTLPLDGGNDSLFFSELSPPWRGNFEKTLR